MWSCKCRNPIITKSLIYRIRLSIVNVSFDFIIVVIVVYSLMDISPPRSPQSLQTVVKCTKHPHIDSNESFLIAKRFYS